jgi:hypothetical protein
MKQYTMKQYMELLGLRVKDKVTGFSGVVSSVCFDLFGCVQAVVTPAVGKDGKQEDGRWFDTKRLDITDGNPVMEVPTFEAVPGGYEKPRASSPLR